ncbi:MAG: hypothetical protein HPY55_12600 [Firmicutes bacterium]|nr:hypothetical protein [Bacillota bacterium]
MNRHFISEGPVWIHFGYGEGQERDCSSCSFEFSLTGEAPAATRDCWKVEVWLGDSPRGEALLDVLMDAAMRDRRLMGKVSVNPMPREATGGFDRVAFMYFTSREEAERFAERLSALLDAGDWRPAVRRGCWHFEPVAGPWETWA